MNGVDLKVEYAAKYPKITCVDLRIFSNGDKSSPRNTR